MEDEDLTIDGNVISTKPYGTGHIQNKSFRGVTAAILVNLEFIDLQDISSEIISLFREVLHWIFIILHVYYQYFCVGRFIIIAYFNCDWVHYTYNY